VSRPTSAAVSVIVPTIGRSDSLAACLRSVRACEPRPDEVLVVDQSGDVAGLVEETYPEARWIRCHGRGVGRATNLGLREARRETVLVTHDDCTVAEDWVGTAAQLSASDPQAIFTGRVLPKGDPRRVPSTIDQPQPYDYSGELHMGVLFANNMVLVRSPTLEIGGFDDWVLLAEDNDLCYRWLRAGRRLRYEPSLVVWHHDWRSKRELEKLYRRYYRGHGRFYAKHLRSGDRAVLRFLARDLYYGSRGQVAAVVQRRPRWSDARPRIWRGLVPGLISGWRDLRSRRAEWPGGQ
jgi:GT2 family glycosyltransferase